MFAPSSMKKVQILVLDRDVRDVTVALGRMGIVHLTTSTDVDEADIPLRAGSESELRSCHALAARLHKIEGDLGVDASETPAREDLPTLDAVEQFLDSVEPRLAEFSGESDKLTRQVAERRDFLREIRRYEKLGVPVDELSRTSFLHFAIGSVPAGDFADVAGEVAPRALIVPLDDAGERRSFVAVSSRKGKWNLQGALDKHGFEIEELHRKHEGLPEALVEQALADRADLDRQIQQLDQRRDVVRAQFGPAVVAMTHRLVLEGKILQAQHNFARTWATALIAGWVPGPLVTDIVDSVIEITGNRAVIEVVDPKDLPEDEVVPTKLVNHSLIRPFEMLVTSYGIPGYREIEPTLFVAVSFLLIFGFMFGDVGQGGVLCVAGLALALARKRSQKVRDVGVLLTCAGVSAMIFGFLYGSVFGDERLIRPLWMNPLKSIFEDTTGAALRTFFGTTMALGFIIINIGLVANIVNRIRRRDWGHAFFDKFGIAGMVFYWGMIALGVRAMVSTPFRPGAILIFVIAPLACIVLHEPLRLALAKSTHKKKSDGEPGPAMAVVFGFVEAMDTVLVFLANTFSFIRVAAFALSHAALCLAVFAVADVIRTSDDGFSLARLMILILGNAFIIALEGLIAAIQTMRLEYYEFFGKFFAGQGRPYDPFTLRASAAERSGNKSDVKRSAQQ